MPGRTIPLLWLCSLIPALAQTIGSCPVFPSNNVWNTPIDKLPVHAKSAAYVNSIGASSPGHADFGSGLYQGTPIGIPFITVPGSQTKVATTFQYSDESDPGPYPVPANAPIEGGSSSNGDRHVLVIDRDNCVLYELYAAYPQTDGSWTAGSGAIFNLKANNLRPTTWTSADAAGLPIFPGLARYDEVAAGVIQHALRFTAPHTQKAFIWPARHQASSITDTNYPPMGQRFRLKASFNMSGYAPDVQVLLRAMQKYGIILADNGSAWFISGAPDDRWDNNHLSQFRQLRGTDFEAVDESSLMGDPNSAAVSGAGFAGSLDTASCNVISGWAADKSRLNQAINVSLYDGGNLVATVLANQSRPDVATLLGDNGLHGFSISTPSSLKDGSTHSIQVQFTDTGTPVGNGTVQCGGSGPPATLSLSRTALYFGFNGSLTTGGQAVALTFGGASGVSWTAAANQSNIQISPASGSGNALLQITATPGSSGAVIITAPVASNSPRQIQVNVASTAIGNPIGSLDTPANNTAGVVGAIAVSGWALDTIEATSVDIMREPVAGEPAGSLMPIGSAVFVADARPDVQAMFPLYPFNYRAGWGYQMLTNFLPNSSGSGAPGNGTHKIHAIAHNKAGNQIDLGTKTITVSNALAAKPFGSIDTPAQGGTISGADYVNFGWALAPQPAMLPVDGSTITVVIDGVVVGHPTYNQFRSDIASLFPGYANTGGAVGFFHLNTTTLANGVHTISWNAFDNQGHGEGLGSRYFNVLNTTGSEAAPEVDTSATSDGGLEPDADGGYSVSMEEMGRIELHLGATSGNLLVLGETQSLPTGSTLKGGVFYWQPGPGFLGEHNLQFERPNGTTIPVRVRIVPKQYGR
jgi:hypothetical protein